MYCTFFPSTVLMFFMNNLSTLGKRWRQSVLAEDLGVGHAALPEQQRPGHPRGRRQPAGLQ